MRLKPSQLLKNSLDWKENPRTEGDKNDFESVRRGGFDWGSAETPHFSPDAEIHPLFGAREFLFRKLIGDDQSHHIIARGKAREFQPSAAIQSLRVRRFAGFDRFRGQLVEDLSFAIYLQLHGQLRLAGLGVESRVVDHHAVIDH